MKDFSATSDIVILAAGGHAAEVFCYISDCKQAGMPVRLLGLIDEGRPAATWEDSRIMGGFEVLDRLLNERDGEPLSYITAVGNNRVRRGLVTKADETAASRPFFPWTLRHPSTYIGRRVDIGEGTMLAPGSLITTRSRIGRHCILNIKASVSHDCSIGDFVNLNPGVTIAGSVHIGAGAFIGAGATVINGISIGAWTIVGAGAVVTRDLPSNVTAVGVPARIIKQHEPQ